MIGGGAERGICFYDRLASGDGLGPVGSRGGGDNHN